MPRPHAGDIWLFVLVVISGAFSSPPPREDVDTIRVGTILGADIYSNHNLTVLRAIERLNKKFKADNQFEIVNSFTLQLPDNVVDYINITCESLERNSVSAILIVVSPTDENSLFGISMIGEYLGLPVVGLGSRSFSFSNKKIHSTYLRLEPSELFQANAIKSILERKLWLTLSVVTSDSIRSQALTFTFLNAASEKKWTITTDSGVVDEGSNIYKLVARINDSKIVVLNCEAELAVKIFIASREVGTKSGRIWILTEEAYTSDPNKLQYYPDRVIATVYDSESSTPGPLVKYMEDSYELIFRAFMQNSKNYLEAGKKISCWTTHPEQPSTDGRHLYQDIIKTEFNGTSGWVQLDENGDRKFSSYKFYTLDQRNIDPYWKFAGSWNSNSGLSMEPVEMWSGRENDHSGNSETRIIVATNEEDPFIMQARPSSFGNYELDCLTGIVCYEATSQSRKEILDAFKDYESNQDDLTNGKNHSRQQKRCCTGLVVDLIDRLSKDIGFEYYLYMVADNNHGAKVNGVWNGMVGDLINETADIAISSFSITGERSRAIDFTTPFFHSGFSILVSKQKVEPELNSFLAPLDWTIWLLIFGSVGFVAISITFFEWTSPYGLHPRGRNRNYTFSFSSALNITFSILFSHTIKSKPPKCMTARFLLNVWGAFSFIFFASYTANLAAFMAGQMSYLQIDGIQDPKLRSPSGQYQIGTVVGSSIQDYLGKNRPHLAEFMKRYEQESTEDALEKLKSGELDVFVYDSPVIEYRMANDPDCRLISVGKTFGEEGFGIGVVKESMIKDPLSIHILEYEADGYLEELQRKWFGTSTCYKDSIADSATEGDTSVGLPHVAGLFILLCAGFIIGFLILLLEYVVHRWAVPKMRTWPPSRRNILVLSQRLHKTINENNVVSSSANWKELMELLRKRQFVKMFQREQINRKSMRQSVHGSGNITLSVNEGHRLKRKNTTDRGTNPFQSSRSPSLQPPTLTGTADDSRTFSSSQFALSTYRETLESEVFGLDRTNSFSDSDMSSYDNFDPRQNASSAEPGAGQNLEIEPPWWAHDSASFSSLNDLLESGFEAELTKCSSLSSFGSSYDLQPLGNESHAAADYRRDDLTPADSDESEEDDDEEATSRPLNVVVARIKPYSLPAGGAKGKAIHDRSESVLSPQNYDTSQMSKEEVLWRWKCSQKQMGEQLECAISERDKLYLEVSKLQSLLKDNSH